MKKYSAIALAFLGLTTTSCEFLDTKPMDFGDETAYFRSKSDLAMSVNTFYDMLPKMHATNNTGIHSEDNTSDNQIGTGVSNLFYEGEKRTPKQEDSQWKFVNLRGINYFINKAEEEIAAGNLNGDDEFVKQYLGEGYFFRAYDYFRLLRNYGDVPIVTKMMPDNLQVLIAQTKRAPRNEVARFILSDLDKAIELMMATPPESGRVAKYAALALKARVALFEATWEKYHAGTCFVPGNAKWPGAKLHPDFQFKEGSAEAEINYFLDVAISASDLIAGNISLNKDYITMFNNTKTEFSGVNEVILARFYKLNVISHNATSFLVRTGAGTGYTRALMRTFLTINGLPIYAPGNTQYLGDLMPFFETLNRDKRLVTSMKGGGRVITVEGDTIHNVIPAIAATGTECSTTGYQVLKWGSLEAGQNTYGACTTANPVFRAAEAYVTYLEAYYERNGNLGGNCDAYWRKLRERAGVDPDYTKTISATDLSQESDLATKWRGSYIDATLYNIRRERRCEFIAEGMRLDDLKRWRSLDNMKKDEGGDGYQPEGMNLWEIMHQFYNNGTIGEGIVSQAGDGNYILPLKKSNTNIVYRGYIFPKQHYLEPIPISEFILLTNQLTKEGILYQNPGWPIAFDGPADYSVDCD